MLKQLLSFCFCRFLAKVSRKLVPLRTQALDPQSKTILRDPTPRSSPRALFPNLCCLETRPKLDFLAAQKIFVVGRVSVTHEKLHLLNIKERRTNLKHMWAKQLLIPRSLMYANNMDRHSAFISSKFFTVMNWLPTTRSAFAACPFQAAMVA